MKIIKWGMATRSDYEFYKQLKQSSRKIIIKKKWWNEIISPLNYQLTTFIGEFFLIIFVPSHLRVSLARYFFKLKIGIILNPWNYHSTSLCMFHNYTITHSYIYVWNFLINTFAFSFSPSISALLFDWMEISR